MPKSKKGAVISVSGASKRDSEFVFKVETGGMFPVPTHTVAKDGRFDEHSLSDSDYDEFDDISREDRTKTEVGKTRKALLDLGLDIDGRVIPDDVIYQTFEKAAEFTPMVVSGQRCEIPCIVLFDFFGGHTCMDLNVTAGEKVHVLAEEFQVRHFSPSLYLRLPQQWSLAHWVRPRSLLSPIGLIPSSYVIAEKFFNENRSLFVDPWWCLGVCEVIEAADYLQLNKSIYQPGLFVVFSPPWLNIDPSEHRPFMILMMSEGKNNNRKSASSNQKEDDESRNKAGKDEKSAYVLQTFTISRTYLGDYEFCGRRYSTLYDLVYHLANHASELPHKLVYGQFTQPPPLPFTGVPAPSATYPRKDPDGMAMMSEQWAAKHHSQVIEPASFSSPYTFVSRTILNTLRLAQLALCKMAGMDAAAIALQSAYMGQFEQAKELRKNANTGTPLANPPPPPPPSPMQAKEVPSDEFALHSDNRLYIATRDLIFDQSKPLGKGEFGAVYAGKLKTGRKEVEVAIKSQKALRVEKDAKLAWLGEMETLTMTCHPNVIRFFGCQLNPEDSSALLVFEIMKLGSMDKFCKKLNYTLSEWEVVEFLCQISRGMGHLHSRQPQIVHGDLAARNVLVAKHPFDSTRYILKITDLGLGKTLRPDMHARYDDPNKIPFKWLPPEVLKGRELTTASDVWSYGMVAHEIYGIGEPYGMSGPEKIVHLLADGHRFERQPKMPNYIYDVVLKCQRRLPADRLTMAEAETLLSHYMIESESSHRDVILQRRKQEIQMKTQPKSDN